jgi:hypothetical protein
MKPLTAHGESLLAADDARYRALNTSDLATLDALLLPEFTYTHSSGYTDLKNAYLDRVRNGIVYYRQASRVSAASRVYGNAGIMSGHMRMIVHMGEQRFPLENLFLAAWIFVDGAWRCAGWSSTTHNPASALRSGPAQ